MVWTAEKVVSEIGTVVSAVEISVDGISDDVLSAVVPDGADPQAVVRSITHRSARLWNKVLVFIPSPPHFCNETVFDFIIIFLNLFVKPNFYIKR